MEKKNIQKVDVESFIEKYNKGTHKMPLDYALNREVLLFFYSVFVSSRFTVIRKLFDKMINLCHSSSNAFDFQKQCSDLKLSDIFTDDEIKTYYYLSIPDPSFDELGEEVSHE